jgi:hypothetical protein
VQHLAKNPASADDLNANFLIFVRIEALSAVADIFWVVVTTDTATFQKT